MGKAAKAHRAKVKKRNQRVQQEKKLIQKKWNEMFEKKMEELKESFPETSGDTKSNELIEDLDVTLPDDTKVQVSGFHNVTEND